MQSDENTNFIFYTHLQSQIEIICESPCMLMNNAYYPLTTGVNSLELISSGKLKQHAYFSMLRFIHRPDAYLKTLALNRPVHIFSKRLATV